MSTHSRSSDLGIGDSSNQDGINFTNSLIVASGRGDPCSLSRSPSRQSVGGDSTRSELSPSVALGLSETERRTIPLARVCFGAVGVTAQDRTGSRNAAIGSDSTRYDAADRSGEQSSKRRWVELGSEGESDVEAKRLGRRDAGFLGEVSTDVNQGNWKPYFQLLS